MTRSLVCWLGEHFLRRDHRIAVDGYGVLYLSGVATGVGHHHWNIARAGHAKYQFIAPFEPVEGQCQSPQLVLAIRVSTCDEANQFGLELAESRAEGVVEPCQVVVVADPV